MSTYARYRGHWVEVASAHNNGVARVYYVDRNKAWAEENGFAKHEMYQYEKYGPMDGPPEKLVLAAELYDMRETPPQ